MKKLIKIALVTIGILVAGALAFFFIFPKKTKSLVLPEIKKINKISVFVIKDTAFIRVLITIKNKTFIPLKTDSVKFVAGFAGKIKLQGEQAAHLDLEAYEEDTVGLTIPFPYRSIMKEFKVERKRNDSAVFFVSLAPRLNTVFGNTAIPLNKSAYLKIPVPPEITVSEINYKKIRLNSIDADIRIKIVNPNDLELRIKEIKYVLDVPGKGKLEGKFQETIDVKGAQTTEVSLPVKIELQNILKTLTTVMVKKEAFAYSLSLKAKVDTNKIFREPTLVEITKKGSMQFKKEMIGKAGNKEN